MKHPTPEQIKQARLDAEQTQLQAAQTVYKDDSAVWRKWESGRNKMDKAIWELYLIKTGQTKKYWT